MIEQLGKAEGLGAGGWGLAGLGARGWGWWLVAGGSWSTGSIAAQAQVGDWEALFAHGLGDQVAHSAEGGPDGVEPM